MVATHIAMDMKDHWSDCDCLHGIDKTPEHKRERVCLPLKQGKQPSLVIGIVGHFFDFNP
jgi:hypothetical protein